MSLISLFQTKIGCSHRLAIGNSILLTTHLNIQILQNSSIFSSSKFCLFISFCTPFCAGESVYHCMSVHVVSCFFFSISIYVQCLRVCRVINSVSLNDTWKQIGAQIQASMKDNMTGTLAARPDGAQCDIYPDCCRESTNTCTLSFTHILRHACEPIRVSSNTVKNIYTLLHRRRQTNELLTNEPTHTHTTHPNVAIPHIKDVTSVLTTIKQYVL